MQVLCQQYFEALNSILDKKPDVCWTLLPANVGLAGLVTRVGVKI